MACGFCEKIQGLKSIKIKAKKRETKNDAFVRLWHTNYSAANPRPIQTENVEILQCQMCLEYLNQDGKYLGYDLEKINVS